MSFICDTIKSGCLAPIWLLSAALILILKRLCYVSFRYGAGHTISSQCLLCVLQVWRWAHYIITVSVMCPSGMALGTLYHHSVCYVSFRYGAGHTISSQCLLCVLQVWRWSYYTSQCLLCVLQVWRWSHYIITVSVMCPSGMALVTLYHHSVCYVSFRYGAGHTISSQCLLCVLQVWRWAHYIITVSVMCPSGMALVTLYHHSVCYVSFRYGAGHTIHHSVCYVSFRYGAGHTISSQCLLCVLQVWRWSHYIITVSVMCPSGMALVTLYHHSVCYVSFRYGAGHTISSQCLLCVLQVWRWSHYIITVSVMCPSGMALVTLYHHISVCYVSFRYGAGHTISSQCLLSVLQVWRWSHYIITVSVMCPSGMALVTLYHHSVCYVSFRYGAGHTISSQCLLCVLQVWRWSHYIITVSVMCPSGMALVTLYHHSVCYVSFRYGAGHTIYHHSVCYVSFRYGAGHTISSQCLLCVLQVWRWSHYIITVSVMCPSGMALVTLYHHSVCYVSFRYGAGHTISSQCLLCVLQVWRWSHYIITVSVMCPSGMALVTLYHCRRIDFT